MKKKKFFKICVKIIFIIKIIIGKTYHERKFHTKYLPHKCSLEGIIKSNLNFRLF